jgi:hypothetical protein
MNGSICSPDQLSRSYHNNVLRHRYVVDKEYDTDFGKVE